MIARCEYNPALRKHSKKPPRDNDCPNDATVSLGELGAWHVCESCSVLPEFKRFTFRKEIRNA